MGGGAEYLSSVHFGSHCEGSFLSGLQFWSYRPLLLLYIINLLQPDSSTELPFKNKGNITLLCSLPAYREHLLWQGIQTLLLHSFLHGARHILPWHFFFHLAFLHVGSTDLSHDSTIFPIWNLVGGSGQKRFWYQNAKI